MARAPSSSAEGAAGGLAPGEFERSLARPDGAVRWRLRPARPGPARGTVVLLHGLASNLSRYDELVAQTRLARDWDLLRLDLRGHGASPTPGPVSIAGWCADLAAVLAAAGARGVVLVGHSLGAQVAQAYTAAHPDAVRGLALIDPLPGAALNARARRWLRAAPGLRALAALARAARRLGLARRDLPLRDLHAEDQRARALLAAHGDVEAFVREYSSTRADLRYMHLDHYLSALLELLHAPAPPESQTCPVLVLLSDAGTFAAPAAVERWAAGFAQGRCVRIDCEHWPLTERPLEVCAALEDWLESIAPAGA
jgi:pimeloyl-ACP methyl ester carboxylesterase